MFIIPLVPASPADVLVASGLKTTCGQIFWLYSVYIQFIFNLYPICKYSIFYLPLISYFNFICSLSLLTFLLLITRDCLQRAGDLLLPRHLWWRAEAVKEEGELLLLEEISSPSLRFSHTPHVSPPDLSAAAPPNTVLSNTTPSSLL